MRRAIFLPLLLSGCLASTTTTTTPVTTAPPVQTGPAPARAVPTLVLSPPYHGLGLDKSGAKSGAELTAMLSTQAEWGALLSFHPLIQVAEENLGTAADLQTTMSGIKALGLTFGVESTPMNATLIKAGGTIGANAFANTSKDFDRIVAAGGTLSQVALNDPLAIALSNGMARPDALQQIATYIALVQAHYPTAAVGFNGVYPKDLSDQHIADIQTLQADLKALGSRGLDFYRVDFAWFHMQNGGGTPGASYADLKLVSGYCDSIGLPFSLIYAATDYYAAAVKATGQPAAAGDDTFYVQGLDTVASAVAGTSGWKPYQIDIQDWTGAPSQALPETDPNTFTGSALGVVTKYR